MLFGVEGQVGLLNLPFDGTLWAVAANARVGFILGGRALVYVEAGVGTTFSPSIFFLTAGGGLEVAFGDRLSAFAEAKAVFLPGGPGYVGTMIQVGLNFHLNRR